jgi:hypothetical protein
MATKITVQADQEVEIIAGLRSENDVIIVAAGEQKTFTIEDGQELAVWPTAGRKEVEFPESGGGE